MTYSLQNLGRIIKRLQYRHHRRLDVALQAAGASVVQWDALRAIHDHPGVSAHALAVLTFQTDQSFGTLADRLIARGLVVRTQGVGRALVHSITAKGIGVLEAGAPVAERVLDDSFKNLSKSERKQLFALVEKVLADEAS